MAKTIEVSDETYAALTKLKGQIDDLAQVAAKQSALLESLVASAQGLVDLPATIQSQRAAADAHAVETAKLLAVDAAKVSA